VISTHESLVAVLGTFDLPLMRKEVRCRSTATRDRGIENRCAAFCHARH